MKALQNTDHMTIKDIPGKPARSKLPDRKVVGDVAQSARHQRIAEAAYYRAECRGFERGCELDDWLAAEAEIDNGDMGDAKAARPRRAGKGH